LPVCEPWCFGESSRESESALCAPVSGRQEGSDRIPDKQIV
jgi:hypothetical protein